VNEPIATVDVAAAARGVPVGRSRAWQRSPLAVAGLVLAIYGAWLLIGLLSGHDVRERVGFGTQFVSRPQVQALMHVDPHSQFVHKGFGWDGQFYYFIAVDPVNARYFVDDPSYRYKHILFPLLARLFALGRASVIPYTMVLINLLAVSGGTLALAAWLRRNAISPWLALIYGLYPALFLSVRLDYTEPLSYGLMALAVYLYSFGGRRQVLGSSVCFALSALARDKAIAFAFFFTVGILLPDLSRWEPRVWLGQLRARLPRAALFGAIAGLPLALYELFLKLWLHTLPAATGQLAPPLAGSSTLTWQDHNLYLDIGCVIIPAAICTGMGLWALKRGLWRFEIFALLITIQLSITLAASDYWRDALGGLMRLSIAVVLLALCCVPIFDRVSSRKRWWLRLCAVCWLALFVPMVIVYGVERTF
jgi:hypothetical protein